VKQRNEEMRKKLPVPLTRPKGMRKFNGNPDAISVESEDSMENRMRPKDVSLESLSTLSSPRELKSKKHSKRSDRKGRLGAVAETAALGSGREVSRQPSSLTNDDDPPRLDEQPNEKLKISPVMQSSSLASYVSSDWVVQCLHGDDWITGDHRWPQAPPPIDALRIM